MYFVKSFVTALAPSARLGNFLQSLILSGLSSCLAKWHLASSVKAVFAWVLLQYAVVGFALNGTTAHCRSHVALEAFSVVPQILGSLLVQRVGRVRLQE